MSIPRLIPALLRPLLLNPRSLLNGSIASLSFTPEYSKQRKRTKHVTPVVVKSIKSKKTPIEFYHDMTLKEAAEALNEPLESVLEAMVDVNPEIIDLADQNKAVDKRILMNLASIYDKRPRWIHRPSEKKAMEKLSKDEVDVFPQPPPPDEELVKRAPVVTIMGHVDHGKTTLLDSLRNSRITAGEFGGITQHIGAFSVVLPHSSDRVTFIDTPGHAAFKEMRSRGAHSTDLVVLVVAADDGANEQTVESIKYIKEAGVPFVVAINKIDKPNADIQKAKRSLMQYDVVLEDMGGDVPVVEISALQGTNLDKLQELLVAQAELMELKSTPKGLTEAVVIESTTVQGVGKMCTLIVNRGTLKRNAVLVAGNTWGRVKSMVDEFGNNVNEAGPSTPVKISGWKDVLPSPGDTALEVESEERAWKVVQLRQEKLNEKFAEEVYESIDAQREEARQIYLTNRQKLIDRGMRYGSTIRRVYHKENKLRKDDGKREKPALPIIIRTDVDGSLEAITNVLKTYNNKEVDLQIVDADVGVPNPEIVEVAAEFEAKIICFNVPIPPKVQVEAAEKRVQIEQFNVIYRLVDFLKNDLNKTYGPIEEMKLIGEGHVLKQFLIRDNKGKKRPIAGTLVDWGVFPKAATYRVISTKTGEVVYEGPVESLKKENEFVTEVSTNNEVGIAIENNPVKFSPDDIIEAYEVVMTPREVNWNPPGF
uniref:Tr-type G domain-containing protein n=1 Tax=Bursaphelenchus xylophilus TaxID=6326 RepID=A0A1I7RRV0_BURXY